MAQSFTDNEQAFPHPYLEYAVGGVNWRNRLCRIQAFDSNGYADVFRSVLRFPELIQV